MSTTDVAELVSELPRMIQVAGQLLTVEQRSEARLDVAANAGSGRVAFSAVGDTCPLCVALDGKVFAAKSPEAARLSPPLHPNCDCIWVEIDDDEVGAQDAYTPEFEAGIQSLLDRHATFINNPDKYEALKVPARPDGRDFTFRRYRDPESGEMTSELVWHRPRYAIEGLTETTAQTGVAEVGPRWTSYVPNPELAD